MRLMQTSTDAIYGGGFRDALAAYRACGHSLAALVCARARERRANFPRSDAMEQLAAWAKRTGRAFGASQPFTQPTKLGDTEPSLRVDTWRRAKSFDEARRRATEKTKHDKQAASTVCRPECEPRRPGPAAAPSSSPAEAELAEAV